MVRHLLAILLLAAPLVAQRDVVQRPTAKDLAAAEARAQTLGAVADEKLSRADVVFFGGGDSSDEDHFVVGKNYQFSVSDPIKGFSDEYRRALKKNWTLNSLMQNVRLSIDCGKLRPGWSYLIYARRAGDALVVDRCEDIVPVADAQYELHRLHTLTRNVDWRCTKEIMRGLALRANAVVVARVAHYEPLLPELLGHSYWCGFASSKQEKHYDLERSYKGLTPPDHFIAKHAVCTSSLTVEMYPELNQKLFAEGARLMLFLDPPRKGVVRAEYTGEVVETKNAEGHTITSFPSHEVPETAFTDIHENCGVAPAESLQALWALDALPR